MAKTRRRKRRTQEPEGPGSAAAKVPQSFVLKRGRLSALVDELTSDVRKARCRWPPTRPAPLTRVR